MERENIRYDFNDEVTDKYSLNFRYCDLPKDNDDIESIIDKTLEEFYKLEKDNKCDVTWAADGFYIIDTENDEVADTLEEICKKCESEIDLIYDAIELFGDEEEEI